MEKNKKGPGSEMGERSGHSQRDDELVRRAGDHGPGAGIDGVDVPVGHDPPLVPQTALNRHERRHCNSQAKPRQEHQKSHSAIEGPSHQTLNPKDRKPQPRATASARAPS